MSEEENKEGKMIILDAHFQQDKKIKDLQKRVAELEADNKVLREVVKEHLQHKIDKELWAEDYEHNSNLIEQLEGSGEGKAVAPSMKGKEESHSEETMKMTGESTAAPKPPQEVEKSCEHVFRGGYCKFCGLDIDDWQPREDDPPECNDCKVKDTAGCYGQECKEKNYEFKVKRDDPPEEPTIADAIEEDRIEQLIKKESRERAYKRAKYVSEQKVQWKGQPRLASTVANGPPSAGNE